MTHKKTYVLILILSLLSISSVPLLVNANQDSQNIVNELVIPDGLSMKDLSPEKLGDDEIAMRNLAAEIGSAKATQASQNGEPIVIGEELVLTISDSGANVDYDETFVALMEGTHGIIMLEKAGYDNYDPITDTYTCPDPISIWSTGDVISTSQLNYLLDQFDNVMYPVISSIYGEPLPRGDEGQKVFLLIHNIRDEAYYDTTGAVTSYVAGYFSSSENALYNKNMVHLDSADWDENLGPDAEDAHAIEIFLSHEFEHLVHFDADPDEESWLDEGCADLAGFFCGYGHLTSHLLYYLVLHPITSLTFWGNGLEDYGASYLFMLYLYEKYGGAEFISTLVAEQLNSIESVEKTLEKFGYKQSFDDIFDDWVIANYLDDTKKAGGKYGYENLEIGSATTGGWTIPIALEFFWGLPIIDFPFALDISSFYGDPQPYTAQYFHFINAKSAIVLIDGDDFAGTLPYSGTYEWYSDAEVWAWRSFYHTFDIPIGGATLNFYTFFEIEEDWDYGYVEVFDHVTGEWYTLDAPGTVNYVAHEQDNPNCPDGREPTAYESASRWHGFTGNSGGWIPVTMDLSLFAGHSIDLYFTTWQDGAFTLQMMYVDDISIPELGFFDDVEAGEGEWTSSGWSITDGILDNNFGVQIIDTKWVYEPGENNAQTLHSIKDLTVNSITQSGFVRISATPARSNRVKIAIISNHAEHILPSGYYFGVLW